MWFPIGLNYMFTFSLFTVRLPECYLILKDFITSNTTLLPPGWCDRHLGRSKVGTLHLTQLVQQQQQQQLQQHKQQQCTQYNISGQSTVDSGQWTVK